MADDTDSVTTREQILLPPHRLINVPHTFNLPCVNQTACNNQSSLIRPHSKLKTLQFTTVSQNDKNLLLLIEVHFATAKL